VNGPPIVTRDGIVLGGNGRSMMIKRAYAERLASADSYRFELEQRAERVFNIGSAMVKTLKQPMLVRVLPIDSTQVGKQQLINLVRIYNEGLTSALTETEKGVAMSKQLDDAAIEAIGLIFADSDESLRVLMGTRGQAFITVLENAGIVTDANRSTYINRNGQLTDTAKGAIEAAFQGRVLETTVRIKQTSPSLLAKIERITPSLVKVAAINAEFSIINDVRLAVDLLNAANRAGSGSVEEYITMEERQEGLTFAKFVRPSDFVISLAKLIEENGQRNLQMRFKAWAGEAAFNPRIRPLFGQNPTQGDTLKKLFDSASAPLSGVVLRRRPGQPPVRLR
jgi:hypothetical protein